MHNVWHEGLIFKLIQNGIFVVLLQRLLLLKRQSSFWINVHPKVLGFKEYKLRLLLFLTYIKDLADDLSFNAKLSTDDISLLSIVHKVNASAR